MGTLVRAPNGPAPTHGSLQAQGRGHPSGELSVFKKVTKRSGELDTPVCFPCDLMCWPKKAAKNVCLKGCLLTKAL